MSADFIVAVIATFISLAYPLLGLLISLFGAAIPCLKDNSSYQEKEESCADMVFTILTATIPNPIVSLLV